MHPDDHAQGSDGLQPEATCSVRSLFATPSQPESPHHSQLPTHQLCSNHPDGCFISVASPSRHGWLALAPPLLPLGQASAPPRAPWATAAARCVHSYSALTGRPKPSPWPKLEHVAPVKEPTALRWHRAVLRPPTGVQAEQAGDTRLKLTGKAGSLEVNLAELDPTGVVAFKLLTLPAYADGAPQPGASAVSAPSARSTLIVASPSKERFEQVTAALESSFQGVMQGFMVGLTVKGVGYRIEPGDDAVAAEATSILGDTGAPRRRITFEQAPPGGDQVSNIMYPHPKPVTALRLRVGFSRPVIYRLPSGVLGFCLKPTLTYLYGLEQARLQQLAQDIRAVRKPNVYTGNGIQLLGEVVKTKARSSRKGAGK